MKATTEELAAAFAEWDRRYREEPDRFMSEVEHLLRSTPADYELRCAIYFPKILRDLRRAARES